MVVALRTGAPISSCGCFGKVDTPPSVVHVVLDFAFAGVAAAAAFTGDVALPDVLGDQPLAGVPFLMLLAIGCSLVFLAFSSLPEDDGRRPRGCCMTEVPGGSKGVGFTNWLVNKAAGVLERKSSRRGFLLGSAMVGSAVAVAGCAPGTQPGSPYNHITDCAGGLCTDGYTEFCCTINNGINACPPGTFVAGWWRADYSSFCNGTRYYMDCNEICCGPNLGNGFCAGCSECRCAGGCDTRRVYCNYFRYGQCHQEIGALGPIACRLVTCTPPYTVAEYACTHRARGRQLHRRARARARVHAAAAAAPRRSPRCCRARERSSRRPRASSPRSGDSPTAPWRLQEFDGTNWSTSSIPFAICSSGIGGDPRPGRTPTRSSRATTAATGGTSGRNGGSWSSSWTSLGGNFISDPAMAADGTGAYAFGRGADDGGLVLQEAEERASRCPNRWAVRPRPTPGP